MNRRRFLCNAMIHCSLFPAISQAAAPGNVNPHGFHLTPGDEPDRLTNEVLDKIVLARRTTRDFRPEYPDQSAIRGIITAGLHAPYALAAVENYKDGPFRRFFIMRKDGTTIQKASALLNAKVKEEADGIRRKGADDRAYLLRSDSWLDRLDMFSALGHVPGVMNAPYFIVIAEHRGIPDLGEHALAHCLENMWLKATALGLGFQIISMTSYMGDDPDFCALLGLAAREWDLMGCAVGYAQKPLPPSTRDSFDNSARWLS